MEILDCAQGRSPINSTAILSKSSSHNQLRSPTCNSRLCSIYSQTQ
ncbi:hypothetical protein [Fischerella sp. PCC 9605]|nr:hypothetical protein [Fischerella sp. PCC 9605]